jgi:ferredoxin
MVEIRVDANLTSQCSSSFVLSELDNLAESLESAEVVINYLRSQGLDVRLVCNGGTVCMTVVDSEGGDDE